MFTNFINCWVSIRLTILNHTMGHLKDEILYEIIIIDIEIYVNQKKWSKILKIRLRIRITWWDKGGVKIR